MNEPTRRKHLEEKEAFHNAILAVPFFLSAIPTKLIAVSLPAPPPAAHHPIYQDKLYYNGSRFVRTRILSFHTLEEATRFYNNYQQTVIKPSEGKEWAEYCKDLASLEGVLYQSNRTYVPYLENKELRELINDLSQLVVYHGLFIEEHLRRTPSSLFRFLDQVKASQYRKSLVSSTFITAGVFMPICKTMEKSATEQSLSAF